MHTRLDLHGDFEELGNDLGLVGGDIGLERLELRGFVEADADNGIVALAVVLIIREIE